MIAWSTQFEDAASVLRGLSEAIPSLTQAQVEILARQAADLGIPVLQSFTPVRSGELQRSTQSRISRTPDGGIQISYEQPATNRYGVEYAPFVVLGHRTRNPEISVPPNPYNQRALEQLRAPLDALLQQLVQGVTSGEMAVLREKGAR